MTKYKEYQNQLKQFNECYNYFVELTKNHIFIGPINEWLIDNYYLIIETKNKLKHDLRTDKKVKKIISKEKYFIYPLIKEIYEKNNYYVTYDTLYRELNKYQKRKEYYFSYEQLRSLVIFQAFIITEKLYQVVKNNQKKLEEKLRIKSITDEIEEKRQEDLDFKIENYIKIEEEKLNNPNYLEDFKNRFRNLGEVSTEIFIELNHLLGKYNINLKDLLKKESEEVIKDNILIANLFASLKLIVAFQNERLIKKVSFSEKLLETDKVYKNMTSETKGLYRYKLISEASRVKNKTEYEYIKDIVEKAQKKSEHIGFLIFKKESSKKLGVFFIVLLFLLSFISAYFLSLIIFKSKLIGFLVSFIPLTEIYLQLLKKIFMKKAKTFPMLKMDFTKGIPNSAKTMVVIPTIIKDTKKIDSLFFNLEKYYVGNKTDNLFFTLLGDCKESKKETEEFDQEVGEYGLNKCLELNKKYGKEIFYFVYRKRVYNHSEDSYLGYERKRGALIHFSKMLLKKFTKEDYQQYVHSENISSLKEKIKYVITLDTDTGFVLNGALKLVGLMAHPLNKPVYDKHKKRIVSGYGIVQPRLSLDIESTNKSIYSQVMAGVGGFDVYSSIVPNFYFDVFKEGSFTGKGIYDLEAFDEILSNLFPENLILSHDLLEGNYLRCGYASDIELIDDFPSSFLVDTKRQHRWARGDAQITPWLFKKVRNQANRVVNNPLTLIHQFKIFDNVRRSFLYISLLLLLILSFTYYKDTYLWGTLTFLSVVLLPILLYLREFLKIENKKFLVFKYYDDLLHGNLAIIMRIVITIATIPFYSFLYLDAFLRAKYRMHISKHKLLNWITAEDAEKMTGNSLSAYLKNFQYNYLVAFIFLVIAYLRPENKILILSFSFVFLIAPVLMWYVSQSKKHKKHEITAYEKDELKEIGERTWKYFETLLNAENNYLIPDNYQLNREEKIDEKTSPTDIGMSILALISAEKMDIINVKDVLFYFDKIITSLEKLETWNGHLYNWYDTRTLKKMPPYFISSVDNGNYIASLMVAKEFVMKYNDDLVKRINRLIKAIDFSLLYTDQNVFSIGYDTTDEKLSVYHYNKFASESRILSYTAIAKGDIPLEHWTSLDKTLTRHKIYKGLLSWSGTSFEYFMPLIFMKSYANTLLDETYNFAMFCQKDYIASIDKDMPWGIGESAYAELDEGKNYCYQAFATPYLKAIETKKQRVVLSPYSTILAILVNPKEVYNNLLKFKKLDMYDDFGFYDAYDYDEQISIYAYYAHHQGMIMASLCNYLGDNHIQKLYSKSLETSAFNLLLKEKVQLNPVIDMKMFGYKKYNYEREKIENDIREYDYLSYVPELSVLSNNRYSTLVNDRGNGFSRYRIVQLNRYRKITEQDYGLFLYIKDVNSKKVWSNTYSPTNVKPDKYNVVFSTDRIKFNRLDNNISTKTEIIVTKEDSAEIRKVTFTNHSKTKKKLELTSYCEVTIGQNITDISHRTFNNLFVTSSFDEETKSLMACRKNNTKKDRTYFIHRLLVLTQDTKYTYETERADFIGRGNTPNNPVALSIDYLSNKVGDNIDPVLSLRTTIELNKGESTSVYLIYGSAKSKERALGIVRSYDSEFKINQAFEYATLANNMNTKLLNITGKDIRNFNSLLKYLYYTSKYFISDERKENLKKGSLTQKTLWKFGISGDYPIIFIEISETDYLHYIIDILKAYEYFKTRGIYVDLVILNKEKVEYQAIIKQTIDQEIYRINTLFDINRTPGKIFVLNGLEVSQDEELLLKMAARLTFNADLGKNLKDEISDLVGTNEKIDFVDNENKVCEPIKYNTKNLELFNGYGGFKNNGQEYVIVNPSTPTPWSNVIANDTFGTVITNNGCGFTYAYNSQMYKITSWSNETVVNDLSEGFKVNDDNLLPSVCTHGFGYSLFNYKGKDYLMDVVQFVPLKGNIKIFDCSLTNKSSTKRKYKIKFWINPSLGTNEEQSSRYLLGEYSNNNALFIRNVYNNDFSNITSFISSDKKISNYSTDKVLAKNIEIEIELKALETKKFKFLLGCGEKQSDINKLLEEYRDSNKIEEELEKVNNYWQNKTKIVDVKTGFLVIDYLLKWLIYQTIASRLNARSGFYQVGGAYGFRDQLQDAINLVTIDSEITKKIILNNARHQFREGDVLHWWHENNKLGLRSRYKDDFLWLIYGVHEYLLRTGDLKILTEKVPFVEAPLLLDNETEKGLNYTYSNDTKSLFEHLELIANNILKSLGENNLPLMGGGDWNDGMNKIGILGKGTSVWLGFFTVMQLNNFIEITKLYDKNLNIKKYQDTIIKITEALNTVGYEEPYYLRAFFDNGTKLGSKDNLECKIDLISQAFAILSGVCPKEKQQGVLDIVQKMLVDDKLKIIKLLTPPFKNSVNNPGYIMDYSEGIRENGGQYTHATAWYIEALLKTGQYNLAYKYYDYINPLKRSLTKKEADSYKVEPYVIAADIYSNPMHPGRGGWTWYTGSAGWFLRVMLIDILGFEKESDKLYIRPRLFDELKEYKIIYHYLTSTYNIIIKINDKNTITLDNKEVKTDYLELKNDGKSHEVVVERKL